MKKTPTPEKKYDTSLVILGIIVFAVVFMFVIIAVSVFSKRNIERLLAKNGQNAVTDGTGMVTEAETETETGSEADEYSSEIPEAASEIPEAGFSESAGENPEESQQTENRPSFTEYFSKDARVNDNLIWENDLRVTATGIEYPMDESVEEIKLLLHFENLTDKKLSLSSLGEGWCSINGYMVQYYWAEFF